MFTLWLNRSKVETAVFSLTVTCHLLVHQGRAVVVKLFDCSRSGHHKTRFICLPPHVHPLGLDTDNSPLCTGQVNRFCTGNQQMNASWSVPDFSECVSSNYRDLHEQVTPVFSFVWFDRPGESSPEKDCRWSESRKLCIVS